MKRMAAAAGLAVLLAISACGNDSDAVQAAPAAGEPRPGSSEPTDPDTPVENPADAGAPVEDPGPMIVQPRPGMDNLRPVTWESAKATSERVVRVQFYGGVEPCDVLDSVEVDYGRDAVTISLFAGSDPAEPDAVCIEIAQLKAVDVELTENLDGREIRDGSPGSVEPAAPAEEPTKDDPKTDDGSSGTPAGKVRGDTPGTAVEPRPGMDNVMPLAWQKIEKLDADTIRIHYTAGVEPCTVLDRVEVSETKKSVTVTLYVGSDPEQPDAMCIAIARISYTDVDLDSPVGDREFVDGSDA